MFAIDWKAWKRAALDLLFPGDCPICERAAYLDEISFACQSCLESVAWIQRSRCKICGVGMDGMDYAGLVCRNCREFTPLFSAGRSMFHLNNSGKALVHEIKYDGEKRVLGDMPFFCRGCQDFLSLLPVPFLFLCHCTPKNFTNEGSTKVSGLPRLFPKKPE